MTDSPHTTTAGPAAWLRLLRPREWLKNSFVLAPLVFAGELGHPDSVRLALLAFALYCVASSAVYVLNDLTDIDEDRRHPVKSRTRPLANGSVSRNEALLLLAGLYVVIGAGCWMLPRAGLVVLVYVALNVAHTLMLQRQPVIDIFSIAIGFVLRVYAGAEAIAVPVSEWMFVTTLCLALYLAVLKRRQELNWPEGTGRPVLREYSAALLDGYAYTAGTSALVFYSLFVMSTRPQLILTIPIVLFGLFRYAWLVHARQAGESPADTVLTDVQLILTVVVWLALCVTLAGGLAP